MKKVTFTHSPKQGGRKPMGFFGVLLRLFLFLLSLAALILLLSFFHRCRNNGNTGRENGTRELILPPDQEQDIPDNPRFDNPELPRRGIENPGENLPPDEENVLPPIDDENIERDENGREVANNRLNVFITTPGDEAMRQWADEFKSIYPDEEYKVLMYDPNTRLLQIQVPAGQTEEVQTTLPQRITDVEFYIFPESMFGNSAAVRPNDPAFREAEASWYFEPIQAYEAWGITQGSEDVTIAIVDSYFDLRHPDLYSDRIVAPYSVAKRNREVYPDPDVPEESPYYFHGSCVSSMALANIDNGNGAAGIAPKCKYIPVSMGKQFSTMTMMEGVLYAIYQGANVINVSAGLSVDESCQLRPIEEQITMANMLYQDEETVWNFIFNLADQRNVTIVWAAGNDNVLTAIDPSKRNENTIRVSALDHSNEKASFSNFGDLEEYNIQCSDISAPGVDILGAVPESRYTLGPGTSYSAPIVAGAVALMKSLDPTLSTTEIKQILRETGKPIAGNPHIGPMLQIRDALLRVKGELVEADEILDNHENIQGLWKTTAMFDIVNNETGELLGYKSYLYFRFVDEYNGEVIGCEPDNSLCFDIPTSVVWRGESFTVKKNMTTTYGIKEYHFSKADNGLLAFTTDDDDELFYMKRTENIPCE